MTMKQISLVAAAVALTVLAAYSGVPYSAAKNDGLSAPSTGESQEYQRDKCIENCG